MMATTHGPVRALRAHPSERGRPPHGLVSRSGALSAEYPRSPGRALRAYPSERGIALIAVLWLTILLTVVASGFAFSMHGEAVAARNAMSLAQARAAADGAVERTAYELMRPRNLPDVWQPDGAPRSWQEGEVKLTTWALDESARIDLNTANDQLLKGLLQNVGGLDPDTAEQVLEAILDWRDADDLRRPNGAEEPDYRAAGRKYKPSNAPFDSVGELSRVLGVTPGLVARIADTLTVYSRQAGINPATASRDALLAIPNMTPPVVDAFIAQRQDALANHLPVPPLPQAGGFAVGAAPVWRVRAEALMPDGVTFLRDAVLRPSADPRRPIIALLWQEGARAPTPQPPSGTADTDTGARPSFMAPESNGQRYR
jgi:general secretion pathway protein K